jgi:hypothetical protein
MYLFKKIVFDCHQATFLSIKKDAGTITLIERLKLSYHLLYCDPCRQFIKQSHAIDRSGKTFHDMLASNPPFRLPDHVRDDLAKLL